MRGFPRADAARAAATRVVAALAREATVATTVRFAAILDLVSIPQQLVQDSWIALVVGREVATNGLPHVDTLNDWTRGVEWVDQQWLAQLLLYELHTA